MPYTPPLSSGISFVFGGATYVTPNGNGIPFVFSQGGIESAYAAGIVPLQLVVTAEGGAPVQGVLNYRIELNTVLTGAAPVNGSVVVQPTFTGAANFAPVGFVNAPAPLNVFAYKVPDVTGVGTPKVPFVVTAARSAGVLFNVPVLSVSVGVVGMSGSYNGTIKPKFSITGGAGRTGTIVATLKIDVVGYSSIEVDGQVNTGMPFRVVGVGRTNVRGIAGFSVPLRASGACDIRLEGGVQALVPFLVAANNSDVKQGDVVASIIFEANAIGSVGSGGYAQFEPSIVVTGIGTKPKYGFVEASFKFSVAATGGSGVAGSATSKLAMSCTASGEYRDFYSGAVQASLRFLVASTIHIPKTQARPCLYIKTSNDRVMVRK